MRAPTVLAQKSLQAEAAERPRGYVDMICDLSVDVYHWKLILDDVTRFHDRNVDIEGRHGRDSRK